MTPDIPDACGLHVHSYREGAATSSDKRPGNIAIDSVWDRGPFQRNGLSSVGDLAWVMAIPSAGR